MGRVAEITRAISSYDPCLYAQQTHESRIDIYRKNRESIHPPHFLFSLTDTWQPTGRPVEWGVEPLLNRIRAMDLWRDDQFVEKLLADQEKAQESRDRDRRNSVEAFLYDFKSQFQKATNDINTSTLKKVK
jgi:hypothetical protein